MSFVDGQNIADPFTVAHAFVEELELSLHEDIREKTVAIAIEGGSDGSVQSGGICVAVEDQSC